MKKLKFIETLQSFGYHKKTYKYLLICSSRVYSTSRDDGIFGAKSFETKREAKSYLRNEVAKIEQAYWKLYVLEEL